jgi:hypothetical protein
MSTQRRAIRSTSAAEICRQGVRNRWQRPSCTEWTGALRLEGLAPVASHDRASASDRTATPHHAERLATKSLQSGYRIVQLVQFVLRILLVQFVQFVQFVSHQDDRIGSPPAGAERQTISVRSANHGLSPRQIPFPSGLARFHPTLPRVPAGRRRWAERYDGKGNMHIQHAT